MRAGKLNEKLVIERSTIAVDDYGAPQETWATLATVRAHRVKLTLEEFAKAYGTASEALTVFRIRWLADISLADRVKLGSIVYDLKAIEVLGRREGLELRCIARP